MKVKIVNKGRYGLPVYKHWGDAGCDLYANIENDITLRPLERCIIPTGIFVAVPEGYEMQVRPRSGLAIKNGVTVLNTPGTVDSGYRNQVGVILINLSNDVFVVHPGDRIAQAVFTKHEVAEWEEVEVLDDTERGQSGFGSSGIK